MVGGVVGGIVIDRTRFAEFIGLRGLERLIWVL